MLSEELGVERSLTRFAELFATNSGSQRLLVLLISEHHDPERMEVLMLKNMDEPPSFPRRLVRKEWDWNRNFFCEYFFFS